MPQLRLHAQVIRPLAALMVATFLHGCMHWTPVREPRTIPYTQAKTFRVTLSTGGFIDVKEPFIVGDSLLWGLGTQRTGVPLAQISLLEARTQDKVATGLLAGTTAVALTILVINAALTASGY